MVCQDVYAVSQGRCTPESDWDGGGAGSHVGQICHAVKLDMSISYMVEDDSERMESTVPPLRNTFVKIRVLKSVREQKMVTVYRLSTMGMTQLSKTWHAGYGQHLPQHGPGLQPHSWFTRQPAKVAATAVLKSIMFCLMEMSISRQKLQAAGSEGYHG
jgi:hypothetical protein